jgi:hypothetical protein
MKTKYQLSIVLFLLSSFLFADYYNDYNLGYSGSADIEYIGTCSQIDWEAGDYWITAREYFPIEVTRTIRDEDAAKAYLLLIILAGRTPTKAEEQQANKMINTYVQHTYWDSVDKLDKETIWLMQQPLNKYNLDKGDVYKVIVNSNYGFIIRISNVTNNGANYNFSYYSFKKRVIKS